MEDHQGATEDHDPLADAIRPAAQNNDPPIPLPLPPSPGPNSNTTILFEDSRELTCASTIHSLLSIQPPDYIRFPSRCAAPYVSQGLKTTDHARTVTPRIRPTPGGSRLWTFHSRGI
jgi:hypothetical protein